MDKYILDTNLFFNMEEGIGLGERTEQVTKNITAAAKKLKDQGKGEFYMPPKIVEEYLSFFEDKGQPFIKGFLSQITIKSPDIRRIQINGDVFYRLIEDIRERSYRGLRVGEEEIVEAARLVIGKGELNKKDFQIAIGKAVKSFRERYRQATRVGFLDSLADLDLIILAKETDGFLVSADEGVIKWSRVFGAKEMSAQVFGAKMKENLY
jgi:RNA ligase partner protein